VADKSAAVEGKTDALQLRAPDRQEHGDCDPRNSGGDIEAGLLDIDHLAESETKRRDISKSAAVLQALAEPSPEAESILRIELANGSRVLSLPGAEHNIRGYSSDLLIVDEAARVESELMYAVRPMLSVSRGRLIALSTPRGTRGWFWESWTKGEGWDRYQVTAAECARISPEFLASERRQLPSWAYEQEYECRFLDSESQCFTRAEIDAAFAEGVEAWVL
jgi:hypothetical protein